MAIGSGDSQQVVESSARVISGAVEQSNVSVVEGMASLIKVSRAYEAYHRAIETFRRVDESTAQRLGT